VNCAAWALAEVTGIPADEMLDLIAPYHDRGWVKHDDLGRVLGVMMPEVAISLLPSLGFRVASYRGTGPAIASGWARWSSRWFPGAALLLIVDGRDGVHCGHTMVARDGLLLDNGNTDGLPGLDHPYSEARVRVALRFDEVADPRRWPIVSCDPTSGSRQA
jgi:hypothetical protein